MLWLDPESLEALNPEPLAEGDDVLTYLRFDPERLAELWVQDKTQHALLPSPLPWWPEPLLAAIRRRRRTTITGRCECGRRADELGHLRHADLCPASDRNTLTLLAELQQANPAEYLAWRSGLAAGSEVPL